MRDCNQSGGDVRQVLDIVSLGAFETGELTLEKADALLLVGAFCLEAFEF
ncbi:hypothetical protein GCM10017710_08990 [Arthrobacter ramosus]